MLHNSRLISLMYGRLLRPEPGSAQIPAGKTPPSKDLRPPFHSCSCAEFALCVGRFLLDLLAVLLKDLPRDVAVPIEHLDGCTGRAADHASL